MFGIDSAELLIIAVVALVVIGPKDLPRVMRAVGQWVGRARGMARHFRSGLDTMMRESELEEMEKSWRANNDKIMRDHPADKDWGEKDGAGHDSAGKGWADKEWAAPVPALEGEADAIVQVSPARAPRASGSSRPRPPPRRRAAPPIPAGPAVPPPDEAS